MVVTFRSLAHEDLPMFAEWLSQPHVEQWWRTAHTLPDLVAEFGPMIDGGDPAEGFVVAVDGVEVGFVQRYLLVDNPGWLRALEPTDTPTNAAGIDYLIGVEDRIGLGIGPKMIRAFVAGTWLRYPEIEAIVVDVAVENRRSWRALEKCGFGRAWSGDIVADDPADSGPAHVYVLSRAD